LQFFHQRNRFRQGGSVSQPSQFNGGNSIATLGQFEYLRIFFSWGPTWLMRKVNFHRVGARNGYVMAWILKGASQRRAEGALAAFPPPKSDNSLWQNFYRIVQDGRGSPFALEFSPLFCL
jgi:hypothetical protein